MKISKYETRLNSNRNVYIAECGSYNIDGRKIYNNPLLLNDFFGDVIGLRSAAEEHVYVACLDQKCHIIGCFEASHGSVNASMFPVREIFQKALLIGAVNIVVSHNHPSGDCTPSEEDIKCTERLWQAGQLLGVSVLDHIVIGDFFYSFHEEGKF